MSCYDCTHFSKLENVKDFGNGTVIYGYCYKNVGRHSTEGYPVYATDMVHCEAFNEIAKQTTVLDGQINIFEGENNE